MKQLLTLGGSLGILALCLGGPGANAQEPAPLPSGPLIERMSDNSAIQITYSYPADKAKPAASAQSPAPEPTLFPITPVRQLTMIHTKPFWHLVRIDIYGNSMGEWYDGRDYFYEAAGISKPIANDPGVGQSYPTGLPDFTQAEFPDMGWISARTYSGVEMIGPHKCLVFKNSDMTAWIDLESRLPVQWQRGGETRTFQQLPPPTEPLVLPPKIAALSAALRHDQDRWTRLLGKP